MLKPQTPNDTELVRRVLEGDRLAFEELLKHHRKALLRIIARRVKPDQVEDILQDTLIKVFQSLRGYSGKKPLVNWLSRLALRACYDHWRKEYRKRDVQVKASSELSGDVNEQLLASESLLNYSVEQKARDSRELLNWALNHLAPADRLVLTLTHLDGYSTQEAADRIGWSRINVKVRAFRARNKLRSVLSRVLNKTD